MATHPVEERALRWFGQSWGAPINAGCAQQATPVGWRCPRCKQPVEAGDSGVTVLMMRAPTEQERAQLGGVTFAVGERVAYHVDCHLRGVTSQWPAFAPHARFCSDGQTNIASAGIERRMRGFSIGHGQRNCTGCGHYLPLAWTARVCATCQHKAKLEAR